MQNFYQRKTTGQFHQQEGGNIFSQTVKEEEKQSVVNRQSPKFNIP